MPPLTPRQCLEALGKIATIREELRIELQDQNDGSIQWKGTAIHPLQPLENVHQKTVRRVCHSAKISGKDPWGAEFDELAHFYQLDDVPPQCFRSPQLNPAGNDLASVSMNHTIRTFYLFRLMVKYKVSSQDQKVTLDDQASASGTLTSLLHDRQSMPWLTRWLAEKITKLGVEVENLNSRHGEKNVLFFLKGGRAMKYFLGKPEEGENDWDTQILINPHLPAEEWYETFERVHDLVLRLLTRFKEEFTKLVAQNAAPFTGYIEAASKDAKKKAGIEEDEDDELDRLKYGEAYKNERVLSSGSCKAELIDVGIPRRDTPAALEEWDHLVDGILGTTVRYPGHRYYLGEYLMMAREAFEEGADLRKFPKRIIRLGEILALDTWPRKEREEILTIDDRWPHLQAYVKSLPDSSESKLLAALLNQFRVPYRLDEDRELDCYFDSELSTLIKSKDATPLPQEIQEAVRKGRDANPRWDTGIEPKIVTDVGFIHRVSEGMQRHLELRAKWVKNWDGEIRTFLKDIWSGVFSYDAELEIQLAITGSFAAELHSAYLRYDQAEEFVPGDLEKVTTIDLEVFYVSDAIKPGIVAKILSDRANILLGKGDSNKDPEFGKHKELELECEISADQTALLFFSRKKIEFMGSKYKPLLIKIAMTHVPDGFPQLSFIRGLPVVNLRYLARAYQQRSALIDEPGARKAVNQASEGVIQMLTLFE